MQILYLGPVEKPKSAAAMLRPLQFLRYCLEGKDRLIYKSCIVYSLHKISGYVRASRWVVYKGVKSSMHNCTLLSFEVS